MGWDEILKSCQLGQLCHTMHLKERLDKMVKAFLQTGGCCEVFRKGEASSSSSLGKGSHDLRDELEVWFCGKALAQHASDSDVIPSTTKSLLALPLAVVWWPRAP